MCVGIYFCIQEEFYFGMNSDFRHYTRVDRTAWAGKSFKAVARTSDTFGTKKNFFVPADFSELRKSWIKKLIPRYTFKVFLCRKLFF